MIFIEKYLCTKKDEVAIIFLNISDNNLYFSGILRIILTLYNYYSHSYYYKNIKLILLIFYYLL